MGENNLEGDNMSPEKNIPNGSGESTPEGNEGGVPGASGGNRPDFNHSSGGSEDETRQRLKDELEEEKNKASGGGGDSDDGGEGFPPPNDENNQRPRSFFGRLDDWTRDVAKWLDKNSNKWKAAFVTLASYKVIDEYLEKFGLSAEQRREKSRAKKEAKRQREEVSPDESIENMPYVFLRNELKTEKNESRHKKLLEEKVRRATEAQKYYPLTQQHVKNNITNILVANDSQTFEKSLTDFVDNAENQAHGIDEYANDPRLNGVVMDVLQGEVDAVRIDVYLGMDDAELKERRLNRKRLEEARKELARSRIRLVTMREPVTLLRIDPSIEQLREQASRGVPGAAERLGQLERIEADREAENQRILDAERARAEAARARAEAARARQDTRPRNYPEITPGQTPFRVEQVDSPEDIRRAQEDFRKGARWCTAKYDTDLEKNPYYKSLETEEERYKLKIVKTIYNASNYKTKEAGDFESMLKNPFLPEITPTDLRYLWDDDKGFKEGMVEYVRLAREKELTMLHYIQLMRLEDTINLSEDDIDNLRQYYDWRKEVRALSKKSKESRQDREYRESYEAAGIQLYEYIADKLNLPSAEQKMYVAQTLIDNPTFMGSGGPEHLEGFRRIVEQKILRDLRNKGNFEDDQLAEWALDAEQTAFNTHKVLNTFESLDSRWYGKKSSRSKPELIEKQTTDAFDKKIKVNPGYKKVVRTDGFSMENSVIGALFIKGVRKTMNPIDNVVNLFLKGEDKESGHGAFSDWGISQIRENFSAKNRIINGLPSENAVREKGIGEVVLIDSFNTRQMKNKCWKIEKAKKDGEKIYRLYVPDMYPVKLFNSYLEAASIGPNGPNRESIMDYLIAMYKQNTPNDEDEYTTMNFVMPEGWFGAKSTMGYVVSGSEALQVWTLYQRSNGMKGRIDTTEWKKLVNSALSNLDVRTSDKMKRWLLLAQHDVVENSRLPMLDRGGIDKEAIVQDAMKAGIFKKKSNVLFPWDWEDAYVVSPKLSHLPRRIYEWTKDQLLGD